MLFVQSYYGGMLFLSVFEFGSAGKSNRTKRNHFCRDCREFAVFILLIAAFKVRRLRVIAYLVIFAPFISAACARKFPPPWASWMLVFAAVLYGMCCAMEGCKAKTGFSFTCFDFGGLLGLLREFLFFGKTDRSDQSRREWILSGNETEKSERT